VNSAHTCQSDDGAPQGECFACLEAEDSRRAVREVWLVGPLEDIIRDTFRRGLADGDPLCEALAARLAEQQRGGR
jgi:hypothetical protein